VYIPRYDEAIQLWGAKKKTPPVFLATGFGAGFSIELGVGVDEDSVEAGVSVTKGGLVSLSEVRWLTQLRSFWLCGDLSFVRNSNAFLSSFRLLNILCNV
jgi:hypothetical protein